MIPGCSFGISNIRSDSVYYSVRPQWALVARTRLSMTIPHPETADGQAAQIALLALWCATVPQPGISDPPVFVLDPGEPAGEVGAGADAADIATMAVQLAALAKPRWLSAAWDGTRLRVRAGPEAPTLALPASASQEAFLTRCRSVDLAWMAADAADSAWARGTGLPARDLAGVTHVVLLGRSTGQGIVSSLAFDPPPGGAAL